MTRSPHLSGIAAVLLVASACAGAQTVYRQVDPQGRITYSDQPPAANARPATVGGADTAGGAGTQVLPYELRQIVQRYPVVFYSGNECPPCGTGRTLLQTRGIPFEERTVNSPADVDALQRLSGQNGLPLLSIGSQQLKGYSDTEWSQYLDAAGYPASINLPSGYTRPPARPLVALQPAAVPAVPGPPAVPAVPVAPAAPAGPSPTPENPAGIRF